MYCFKHKYKAKSEALQLIFVIIYCFKHKYKAKSDQEFETLFKTIDNDIDKFQFSP